MRILHAPANIADQPGYVVRALREAGHDAELWEYGPNAYGFAVDRMIPIDDGDPVVFWRTFLEAVERFDVFHFHFARSLFPRDWGGLPPFWDLPIYRALGKPVFFTFHGSDIRIRRIHEEVNPHSYFRTSDIVADDDRTEKVIEICRAYASRMFVVSVDYLHYVPEAEVMPRIIDLRDWPAGAPDQRAVPVVLHVPSHRGTKGTDRILAGLEQVRAAGVKFELQVLEGVSHDEARRRIAAADVVVDNLITGDYELVSIEAMASGRVAVANVDERVLRHFPDVPVHRVEPDDFVDRMRTLLADLDLRRDLAARGRPYVARVHDVSVMVPRLLDAYAAPPRPVTRSFPDWLSLGGQRRVEGLERTVSRLEQELARSRRREDDLRRQLGLEPLGDRIAPPRPTSERLKDLLPASLRRRLRKARARVERRG